MPTVVYETAEVVMRDGTQQFKLNGICTAKGELDDTHIFLLTIIDKNDPTDDVFKRLCTIGDISEYKISRDAAAQAGDLYWRSSSFTVFFDDVDVAAAAKTALNNRVDQLTVDYATYSDEFEDSGTEHEFPTGEVVALTTLIEAYYTAWKEYDTAKKTHDAADTAKALAMAALTGAQSRLDVLSGWEAIMQSRYGEMDAAHADFDTFVGEAGVIITAIQTFIAAYDGGASVETKGNLEDDRQNLVDARAVFMENREAAELNVTAANTGKTNHSTSQGEMTGLIGVYEGAVTTAQGVLADAITDEFAAETAKTAKSAALTIAYEAVRDVKSDWTPDSWFSYPF